jgi:hypothetical protein
VSEQVESKHLIKFQADVLNGRTQEARAFMGALAQEFTNKQMEALAEEHQLIHWQHAEDFDGNRVILARDFSRLLYGTENIGGISNLYRRHNIEFYSLGGSKRNVKSLKEHFALSKLTSQVNFVAWDHLMIAAAHGETKFAVMLWNRIQELLVYAAADLESREQTGQGFVDNATRQIQKRQADDLRIALDELRAWKDLLLEMGHHPANALVEATKHAEEVTGLDLSHAVNASPLMRDVPDEEQYMAVSLLEKRLHIPPRGHAGHHFNLLLEKYGLQEHLDDGTWQPTARALAERMCLKVKQKNKTWSGFVWWWKLDLAARIAEWSRRATGLGDAA